jgi:hypothetical protein
MTPSCTGHALQSSLRKLKRDSEDLCLFCDLLVDALNAEQIKARNSALIYL